MKSKSKVFVSSAVLIAGLVLNFLFGHMPPSFKQKLNSFASQLGMSYTLFWILITSLVVLISLVFVWKQSASENTDQQNKAISTAPEQQSNDRKVKMTGEKSLYVEKNEGNINIS